MQFEFDSETKEFAGYEPSIIEKILRLIGGCCAVGALAMPFLDGVLMDFSALIAHTGGIVGLGFVFILIAAAIAQVRHIQGVKGWIRAAICVAIIILLVKVVCWEFFLFLFA